MRSRVAAHRPRGPRRRATWAVAVLIALPGLAASSQDRRPDSGARRGSGAPPPAAAADSGLVLRGGQEGTALRTLTVEGEDRIQFTFDRPTLTLDLDPLATPGLEWGSPDDVLRRTVPDLTAPFLALSAKQRSPYLGRPWLRQFTTGPVATFRPRIEGVKRWRLLIADSRGATVAAFEGGGKPREIAWNGLSEKGEPVPPGHTYSSIFEAYDRAGNKRSFVGEGFQVAAYRIESPAGPILFFPGDAISARMADGSSLTARSGAGASVPPLLLEAASWINQTLRPNQPVRITAAAKTAEAANALAGTVTQTLAPFVLGGMTRLEERIEVQADAPLGGTVKIAAK